MVALCYATLYIHFETGNIADKGTERQQKIIGSEKNG